jgi:hypothetical protein
MVYARLEHERFAGTVMQNVTGFWIRVRNAAAMRLSQLNIELDMKTPGRRGSHADRELGSI